MTFFQTSLGKKVVMAITGFIVFGFVVVHMLGNLQLFLGAEVFNNYAALLQGLGGALWVFRGVLLISLVLHMISSAQVTLQSWNARPVGYQMQKYNETTYAARTMRVGGPIIGLFVVYHLLHFTTGHLHPDPSGFIAISGEQLNVYNNVVYGFQVSWTSGVYMVAMVMVGLHLYHGLWSMLQSVGASKPELNKYRKVFAAAFAAFVTVVGVSIPLAVLAGIVVPV